MLKLLESTVKVVETGEVVVNAAGHLLGAESVCVVVSDRRVVPRHINRVLRESVVGAGRARQVHIGGSSRHSRLQALAQLFLAADLGLSGRFARLLCFVEVRLAAHPHIVH